MEGVTGDRHPYSDMGRQFHGTVRHDVFIDHQHEVVEAEVVEAVVEAVVRRLSRRLTPLLARANLGALVTLPARLLGGAGVKCSRCQHESHLQAIYLVDIAPLTCN